MQNAECRMQSERCATERRTIMKNIIEQKRFDFAVRVINLYKYLTEQKKEYVLSKQLLKAGTSIGANVAEGEMRLIIG